ncbi:MAG: hypothetical protein KDC44_09335, partial [Phaeodactylibacter sp.]|nr:hypothetical protein [Phaeodactylibacter sp.]
MQTAYGLCSNFHYSRGLIQRRAFQSTWLLSFVLAFGFIAGANAQTTSTPLGKVFYHLDDDPNCNFTADYCGNVNLAVTTNQGYNCTTTSASQPFTIGEDDYNWTCDPAVTSGTAIFTLLASRDGGYANGVSVFDLLTIQQHILGVVPLTNPFFRIAADASNSSGITVLDITLIRQVLLAYTQSFPAGSWRFIPKFYFTQNVDFCDAFNNNPFNLAATNPFLAQYDYLGYANGLVIVAVPEGFALPASWYDFYGIKVGDVTGNASDAALWSEPVDDRTLLSTALETDPALEEGTAVISVCASTSNP